MTFNESNVVRDDGGKFGEKTGSAPGITLPWGDDSPADARKRARAKNIVLASTNADGSVSAQELARTIGNIDPGTIRAQDFGALHGALEKLQLEATANEGCLILRKERPRADRFVVAIDTYEDVRVVGYTQVEDDTVYGDVPQELNEWFQLNSTYLRRPGVLAEHATLLDDDNDDWDSDPKYVV